MSQCKCPCCTKDKKNKKKCDHEKTYIKLVTFKNNKTHIETKCKNCNRRYYLPKSLYLDEATKLSSPDVDTL
jgi:hypothetical protein